MRTRPHLLPAAILLILVTSFTAASGAEPQRTGAESDRAVRAQITSPARIKEGQSFFLLEILEGPRRGQTVEARCPAKYHELLQPGHTCLMRSTHQGMVIVEPLREGVVLALVAVLAVCIGITMGARGLRVLASMLVAVLLVTFVFLPLALRGWPPLLLAAITGALLCGGGIVLIGGWNRKSLYAATGSLCALGAAICFPVIVCRALAFTGLGVEFGMFYHPDVVLWYSPALASVSFYQLMLAGMLVASLGATMDAAMGVSTAIWEVKDAAPEADRARLRRAGLFVGRDIMGTMIIAIILVYAGYQFEMLLLFHIQGLPYSPGALLNHEEIAVEVVRMICTGLSLALAIPFTTLIAAHFLGRRYEPKTS